MNDRKEELIQELMDKYNYDRVEIGIIKNMLIGYKDARVMVDIPSFVRGWQACKAMAKDMPEDFKRVLNLME